MFGNGINGEMNRVLIVILALLAPAICWGDSFSGRVVGVSDGDTVTVLVSERDQYKVRISGIDAPEKKQAFGQKAKAMMSDLVYGKDVVVEWSKRDRYGRTIGVVMVDGQDAGLTLLRAGLAWHYKQYQREQTPAQREQYGTAEETARAERVGLWADDDPMPPWEWRHNKR
jgi:endonuclease YncB( thermonuclease family)